MADLAFSSEPWDRKQKQFGGFCMAKIPKTKKNIFSFINLSDEYERKARFCPAVLTLLLLLPAAFAVGVPLKGWLTILIGGTGLSAILSIGLSHLASAMGNRMQQILWPRWPYDSPTNIRLSPTNSTTSAQQKNLWYSMIKDITGLDIATTLGGPATETEAIINDAVSQLRPKLWKSPLSERLDLHNCDYGFARNFTGLRVVWLPLSAVATIACWTMFLIDKANLPWCIVATVLAVMEYPLAFTILPAYVRRRAAYYADSFFDAVKALHDSSNLTTLKGKSNFALASSPKIKQKGSN
jgi:hypothetical protein